MTERAASLDAPIPFAQMSGQAQGRFLGLTQAGYNRLFSVSALTSHALMIASGKFSGNGWEVATGIVWVGSASLMWIFAKKPWVIKPWLWV